MIVKHTVRSQATIVGVLAVAAALAVYGDDILLLLQRPSRLSVYDDDINDNGRKISQDAQLLGDWEFLPNGLALRPGLAGTVIYKVAKEADEDVLLVLWYYWNELRETSVEVSADGSNYQTVLRNTHLLGRSLRLTPYVIGHREIWIRLNARFSPTDSVEPWIVLDKIQIIRIKNPAGLPYVPGIFLFVAIPLAVMTLAQEEKQLVVIALALATLAIETILSQKWPFWIGAGLNIPLPAGSGIQQVTIPWTLLCYSIAVARAAMRKGRTICWRRLLPLIIALALVIRWDVLMEFQYRPLDPDAVGYRQITEAMKHPYDTSYREPLWIWIIKIWYVLLGSSDLNLRLLSILFSLFLLIGAYKLFSGCVRGALPTLIAVTLLAVNPYLAFMSVRGLRLELYTIAILLLIGDVLIPSEKLTAGRRTMGLAVWGTATTMVQLNSLVFVPFLWAYAYWRHRLDWQKAVFMCGTLAVVLTPYLLYCREKYGDPFWSSNVHAKWYRNYEFVARKGIQCEGCPTLEEYQARGHSGAPVTAVHYIFGMHGIGEVITRLGVGYADLFIRPSPYLWRQIGIGMPVLYYVYLVGLAGILLSPARILLAVAVIVINFIAFLIPLGIDARLVMHVAPFVCFVVGYGFWALTECMRWAAKAWVKGETD